jgi:hypothetical protein
MVCFPDCSTVIGGARFKSTIIKAEIQQQTTPLKESSKFFRILGISQRWSTLARNIYKALCAKKDSATRTDWKLTIINITQYQ